MTETLIISNFPIEELRWGSFSQGMMADGLDDLHFSETETQVKLQTLQTFQHSHSQPTIQSSTKPLCLQTLHQTTVSRSEF